MARTAVAQQSCRLNYLRPDVIPRLPGRDHPRNSFPASVSTLQCCFVGFVPVVSLLLRDRSLVVAVQTHCPAFLETRSIAADFPSQQRRHSPIHAHRHFNRSRPDPLHRCFQYPRCVWQPSGNTLEYLQYLQVFTAPTLSSSPLDRPSLQPSLTPLPPFPWKIQDQGCRPPDMRHSPPLNY